MPAFGHGSCIVCLTRNATKTVKWTIGTQTAAPETIDAKVCDKCAELIEAPKQ